MGRTGQFKSGFQGIIVIPCRTVCNISENIDLTKRTYRSTEKRVKKLKLLVMQKLSQCQ